MSKKSTKKTASRKVIEKVNAGRAARGAKPIPKRAYARKPKTVDIKVAAGQPGFDSLHPRAPLGDAAVAPELGSFSANGFLEMNVRDAIVEARGRVVSTIRNFTDSCVSLGIKGTNASASERDVLIARQRLAIAELELSLDGLERAVRGK